MCFEPKKLRVELICLLINLNFAFCIDQERQKPWWQFIVQDNHGTFNYVWKVAGVEVASGRQPSGCGEETTWAVLLSLASISTSVAGGYFPAWSRGELGPSLPIPGISDLLVLDTLPSSLCLWVRFNLLTFSQTLSLKECFSQSVTAELNTWVERCKSGVSIFVIWDFLSLSEMLKKKKKKKQTFYRKAI